ncbi:MAG: hypothetical protein Q8916_09225 [Bacteroidota bacterium]|nr:hypothetical protein [Bacteroidota bacterium]MDP4230568.1 hypothetical protein [Bacteroidota bacterium]MDP4235804.1 hypothetical protein [Bacteroidota bacterium]
MKTNIHFRIAACALIVAVVAAGCSNSSEPGNPRVTVAFGAGSTFRFNNYRIDTLGNFNYPSTSLDSVEAVGLTVGGKTNVIRINEKHPGDFKGFDYFIAYEPNGDFSIGDSSYSIYGGIDWETYPTGSHLTSVFDTVLSGGELEHTEISYADNEMIQVAGRNFNAVKIRMDAMLYDSYYHFSEYAYLWYVPEINFFVKYESHSVVTYTDYGDVTTYRSGSMFVLDSYDLKWAPR